MLGALCALSHFSFTITLRGRHYHYCHSTDEDTKATEGLGNSPKVTLWYVAEPGFEPKPAGLWTLHLKPGL